MRYLVRDALIECSYLRFLDEKGVVCSRVDPAEHCVPAPDLTSPYLSKLPSPKKPVAETLTVRAIFFSPSLSLFFHRLF